MRRHTTKDVEVRKEQQNDRFAKTVRGGTAGRGRRTDSVWRRRRWRGWQHRQHVVRQLVFVQLLFKQFFVFKQLFVQLELLVVQFEQLILKLVVQQLLVLEQFFVFQLQQFLFVFKRRQRPALPGRQSCGGRIRRRRMG